MEVSLSDKAAQSMIEILQQLNNTLVENLRLQNERIAKIEEGLSAGPAIPKSIAKAETGQSLHDSDIEAQGGQDSVVQTHSGEAVKDSGAQGIGEDSGSNAGSHPIITGVDGENAQEQDGKLDDNIQPDKQVMPGEAVERFWSEGEPEDLDTTAPHPTSTMSANLETSPHESSEDRTLFGRHPEARKWFEENMWIPDDGRVPLIFDIESIMSCRDIKQAREICQRLHNFNQILIENRGRMFILDSNAGGGDKKRDSRLLFGNFDSPDPASPFRQRATTPTSAETKNRRVTKVTVIGGRSIFWGRPARPDRPGRWSLTWSKTRKFNTTPPLSRLMYTSQTPSPLKNNNVVDSFLEGLTDAMASLQDIQGVTSRDFFSYKRNWDAFKGLNSTEYHAYSHQQQPFEQDGKIEKYFHWEDIALAYSWFSIFPDSMGRLSAVEPTDKPTNSKVFKGWRIGPLYGDTNSRYLGKQRFNIQCRDFDGDGSLYTIVIMKPSPLKGQEIPDLHRVADECVPDHSAQICLFQQSLAALRMIETSTTEILDYVDKMLDIGDDILLDSRKHDELLYYDDSFSRSRKYWWAINLLGALKESIQQNYEVHQKLMTDQIKPIFKHKPAPEEEWTKKSPFLSHEEKEELEPDEKDQIINFRKLYWEQPQGDVVVKSLDSLLLRIDVQQKRAEALRNGLFTASGVVESRASTRLGEIVKLLTYVSIFYLPLTFSTSLWATTDTFHNLDSTMLFVVMLIVGLVTYSVVFNLNHIVQFVSTHYLLFRETIVDQMKDDGEDWKKLSSRFKEFKLQRFNTSPSEWWVLWYILSWPFRMAAARPRKASAKPQTPDVGQGTLYASDEEDKSTNKAEDHWIDGTPMYQKPQPAAPPTSQNINAEPRSMEVVNTLARAALILGAAPGSARALKYNNEFWITPLDDPGQIV